jgi:hypothetical protein
VIKNALNLLLGFLFDSLLVFWKKLVINKKKDTLDTEITLVQGESHGKEESGEKKNKSKN